MNIYFLLCGLGIVLQNAVKFWAYTSCFKLKVKPWQGYTIFLLITSVATFGNLYYQLVTDSMTSFMIPIGLLFIFLPFHFLTEGNLPKKLIFFIIENLVIDSIIEFSTYFFHDKVRVSDWSIGVFDYGRFLLCILFCLIVVPVKYILVKVWNRVNKTDNERFNPLFLVFPVSQIIAYGLLQLERYYSDDLWGLDSITVTSIYFIVLAASNVVYIIFISDVEKKNELEREYNALNYTRQLEEARYCAIEEKQSETAKIRHDIKNQLIVIKNLLNSGNSEEAAALLGELETDINATKEKEYCSVPIINALLFEKEKTCIEEHIAFESDIAISDTGCISKNHLCSIFSNLLDNAVKECGNLEEKDRRIMITAAQKNGFISVYCENSAREVKKGVINPSDSKGYGMKILRDIANCYDGRYRCEIGDKKCCAEITVNIL